MGSLAALLLAAAAQVPLGGAVTVTVERGSALPAAGQVVGEFLVASAARPGSSGRVAVELRPLALGTLTVPLAGGPRPAVVEVTPTLAASDALAPPRAPSLPLPRAWLAGGGLLLAGMTLLAVRRRRRTSGRDPVVALRQALAPYATEAGWRRADGADPVAHAVREFLAAALRRPFVAMTTREVAGELVVSVGPVRAAPFVTALELADALRFAGAAVSPETGARCVAVLLETVAPAVAARVA